MLEDFFESLAFDFTGHFFLFGSGNSVTDVERVDFVGKAISLSHRHDSLSHKKHFIILEIYELKDRRGS